ncbi:MAG TPA: hypothetical protein VG674_14000 [Amycolatopsis sp.]|nr:hypothetical protein [Amycolatopsis sp.]
MADTIEHDNPPLRATAGASAASEGAGCSKDLPRGRDLSSLRAELVTLGVGRFGPNTSWFD